MYRFLPLLSKATGTPGLCLRCIAAISAVLFWLDPPSANGQAIHELPRHGTPLGINPQLPESWVPADAYPANPYAGPPEISVADPPWAGLPPEAMEVPIDRFRRSFYQGAEVLGGYLWDTGDAAGGLDQTFEEARVSFGLPLGSMDNILGIRPFFRAEHLNGPTAIDLPETLYSTGVALLNQIKWSEKISTTVVVAPAVRSDFRTSENSVRIFGLGLVNWKPQDNLTLSVGAVFFDRNDVSVLPAIGIVYLPRPWWKIDATMPRPRIARRIWKQGGEAEAWAYLGGRLGGNTWVVKRDTGLNDELTLRDFQILGGYEVMRKGNRGLFIEGGYAFGRSIEYEVQDIEIDLDDGVFIQAGWQF